MMRRPTRRTFLHSIALAGVGSVLASRQIAEAASEAAQPSICAFTKPLQKLSFDELADRIAELGFGGIEAPVRPGGHIEPERAADELPQLVEALGARGLKVSILTSGINRADQPPAEEVLRTAAGLGIPLYRMAYYQYDLDRPVVAQLAELKPVVRDLAAMSRDIGITPVYQNHSGRNYVGAPLWDLHKLLGDLPPEAMGVAFDLGHATIEGGLSWPIQVNLLRPRMRALYVKDFAWKNGNAEWAPLGEGRSDPKFYRQMQSSGFEGPISIHVEYLDHDPNATTEDFLAAFQRDLARFREWWQS